MSTLAPISAGITLEEYAQGAHQRATRPVAEFLAPEVKVPTAFGLFAKWTDKHRFSLPQTVRAIKSRAMAIELQKLDTPYECTPHAVDVPVDRATGENVEMLLRDGIDLGTDIEGLVHLTEVVNKAKAAAGAGTDSVYNTSTDPVALIDQQIRAVILGAKAEGVGVLFGDGAWLRFKNHPLVVSRCNGGPDFATHPGLFHARAEYMPCHAIYDASPDGLDPSMAFVLDSEILVFSRSPKPNRRDPSFMKTFRLEGYTKDADAWERRDGRVMYARVDWVSDAHVTNTVGVSRINYLPAS